MNTINIESKFINGGKKTVLQFPIPKLDIHNQIHEILVDRYYEPKYEKNDICIDVGANIGMASLYLKNFCKRVYSIEPSPKIYAALVENVKGTGIKTFNHAIFIDTLSIRLMGYRDEPPQTTHVDSSSINAIPTEEIFVPAISLKTFMEENGIDKIDVLKIDVEGSEYEIFGDDSFDEVAPKINCIVGETHYTMENAVPQLAEYLLRKHGFNFKFLRGKRTNNMFKQVNYDKAGKTVKSFKFPLWTNFIAWKTRK
jgi:FkbM family methyltransferase